MAATPLTSPHSTSKEDTAWLNQISGATAVSFLPTAGIQVHQATLHPVHPHDVMKPRSWAHEKNRVKHHSLASFFIRGQQKGPLPGGVWWERSVGEEENKACNVGWSLFPSVCTQSNLLILDKVTQRDPVLGFCPALTSSPLLALVLSHPLRTHQTSRGQSSP